METQRWQVISMSDVPSNHTRFIELANWGCRLVTVDQTGTEVDSTEWNRAMRTTQMAQLNHALGLYGVVLDDNVNSLDGIHQISITANSYTELTNWIVVEIWQRADSPLYVWQATTTLNNEMKMTSDVSIGHGLSQLALSDALEALGRGYNCVMNFTPRPPESVKV